METVWKHVWRQGEKGFASQGSNTKSSKWLCPDVTRWTWSALCDGSPDCWRSWPTAGAGCEVWFFTCGRSAGPEVPTGAAAIATLGSGRSSGAHPPESAAQPIAAARPASSAAAV